MAQPIPEYGTPDRYPPIPEYGSPGNPVRPDPPPPPMSGVSGDPRPDTATIVAWQVAGEVWARVAAARVARGMGSSSPEVVFSDVDTLRRRIEADLRRSRG